MAKRFRCFSPSPTCRKAASMELSSLLPETRALMRRRFSQWMSQNLHWKGGSPWYILSQNCWLKKKTWSVHPQKLLVYPLKPIIQLGGIHSSTRWLPRRFARCANVAQQRPPSDACLRAAGRWAASATGCSDPSPGESGWLMLVNDENHEFNDGK